MKYIIQKELYCCLVRHNLLVGRRTSTFELAVAMCHPNEIRLALNFPHIEPKLSPNIIFPLDASRILY